MTPGLTSTKEQVTSHVPPPVEVVVVQEPLLVPPSSDEVVRQLEEAKRLSREMAAKWVCDFSSHSISPLYSLPEFIVPLFCNSPRECLV